LGKFDISLRKGFEAALILAVLSGCSLAWVYLRESLRAWRSEDPEGEAAPAGAEPAQSQA
jgi:hypothetical protein